MRLLVFSDLHLDARFAWLEPVMARRRRQALRDTLLKILGLAREENVEAVLSGGDLFEQDRLSPDTGEFLRRAFEGVGPVRVFLAPGNHDWYGPESLYRRVRWSSNVEIFEEDRLQPIPLKEGLTLWGAAHRAPAATDGFLDGFEVEGSGIHLALFHGSERGFLQAEGRAKEPHAPFDAEQIEAAGLDHAFLGHYHRPRDAERHTYPGNPEPLAFGEEGMRGVVIARCSEDGTLVRQRRSVAVSEVHDVELDLTGCASNQDVLDRMKTELAPLRGTTRVTLCGEVGTEVSLDRQILGRDDVAPHLDALSVRFGSLWPAYDLEAIAREPTVRGRFVTDVLAAELPEKERRRVLVTGLRALDGRDDLEVPA